MLVRCACCVVAPVVWSMDWLRTFPPQVQANRLKEKAAEKKANMNTLKNVRASGAGPMDERAMDAMLAATGAPKRSDASPRGRDGGPAKRNKKRERKDATYGYGGKKKHVKDNTADSLADFGMSKGRMKMGPKKKRF